MDNSRERGVDQLLGRVQPQWDHERHERVFAGILDRIQQEQRGGGKPAAPGRRPRLRLSHAAR
jgi:hypothetical protein